MAERFASVNGVEICHETLGDPGGRPLLLIMGLGGPLIWWDDELCRTFVERGFYVIRYDNRDCGRSTRFPSASYTLGDMASDAAGLLDRLGLPEANVMGISMGGMVAQALASSHPDRVRSLTSIMATTGNPAVGWPTPRVVPAFMRPPASTREEYVEGALRLWRLIGSPGFPLDEQRVRRRATATFDRGIDPGGTARQLMAIAASGDRTGKLRNLRVPTLVVHGADDPLIDVSGGIATAKAIPGAELLVIRGMGHDLPPAVWPTLAEAVDRTAKRGEAHPPQPLQHSA
jgi:pimeloyl-ACP methyl ester carboxylesterase